MAMLEILATGFGLACVWLTVRQNIWCWPAGLVQVCLFVVIFYEAKLYSDVGLHLTYIVLQLYGWRQWLKGGSRENPLPVTRLEPLAQVGWLTVVAAGTAGLGFVMSRYTDAAVPYPDAAIAVMSLAAQYLIARKVLENWLYWIAVDVLGIGVYAYKSLYVTSGLYMVFLVLATLGWFTWRKSLLRARIGAEAV